MTASRALRARRSAVAGVVLVALATLTTLPAAARPASPTRRAELVALDPGTPGADAVDELDYDLGTTAFQPDGFPGQVELQGQVYAPETITGRAPLVILLHGRHGTCATATTELLVWPCPAEVPAIPSFQGYGALGRNLASHGMVVVSIGANGVNAADGYVDDGGAQARAELVLEHLRRWKAWDASADGSPFGTRFVDHLDLTRVGLMGHSRGGEGVVAAAQLNQRIGSPFGIAAVMALAPVDFDRRVLGGVPLGVILPYCDGDVSDLQGASFYDDSRYASPGDPAPKMTTLLYGANHNFFNTVWTSGPGSFDDAGSRSEGPIPIDRPTPSSSGAPAVDPCLPGGPGRLAAPAQEQAGAVLMAGFFRRYLDGDLGFQRFVTGVAPFPASTGVARWAVAYHAPDRLDIERFNAADTALVDRFGAFGTVVGASSGLRCSAAEGGFSESGPTRAAPAALNDCPTPEILSGTNQTGALDAGWVRAGALVRVPLLATGTDVTAFDGVRLRVAVPVDSRNASRPRLDLTVLLEDASGHRASVTTDGRTNATASLRPGNVRHAVLNGIRLPLTEFAGVDLAHVRAVELRFDRTNAGRLLVSDLAFTEEGTGTAVGPTAGAAAVSAERPSCRRTEAARWGCSLAQLLWGRDPDPIELGWLSAGYRTAPTRTATIARAVADPAATDVVGRQFGQRFAQADIVASPVADYLSPTARRSWEGATTGLVATLAFGSPRVGTERQIVEALYGSLLGRKADPAGLAYWTPRIRYDATTAIVSSLLRSGGHARLVVDARYRQILGRDPDPSGRGYWEARQGRAGNEQALVRALLDTEAYRTIAIR